MSKKILTFLLASVLTIGIAGTAIYGAISIPKLKTTLDNEVSNLQDQINTLKNNLNTLKTEMDSSIKSVKDDYTSKINDVEKEINDLQDQINKLSDKFEADKAALEEKFNTEISALETQFNTEMLALEADYNSKIATINTNISELNQKVTSLTNEMNNKIEQIQNDYNSKINSAIERISALEASSSKTYTVSFDTNGGTVIPNQTIKKGERINKPQDPVKNGYEFISWTLDGKDFYLASESNKAVTNFELYSVYKDITLVANYKALEQYVEIIQNDNGCGYFKVNNGEQLTNYSQMHSFDDSISITVYPSSGNTFNHWEKDGVNVSNSATYNFKVTGDTSLVAVYDLKQIKCTFKNYDGITLSTQYVDKGENVVYAGENPSHPKQGTDFMSWNGWDKSLNNITEDIVFTAQFINTGDTEYYYCVFVDYNNEELYSTSTFGGGGITYQGKTPSRPQGVNGTTITNYTFSSWDKSLSNINTPTTFSPKFSSTTYTGYKVTFLESDNTELYSYYVKKNTDAVYPYNIPFTYDSTNVHMFTGWSESINNITAPVVTKATYKTIARSANGEYPQTLVKDTDLENTLIALSKTQTPNEKGYYTYNGEQYYAYNGVSYTDNIGNQVTSGTHFYKVEPIQWKFLSKIDGQTFVTSEYLLDAHYYDDSSNNYKDSEIRNWLNNDFISRAFDFTDNIAITAVDNSVASTGYSSNPYVCPTTNDKIFLLSYSELTNASYGFKNDSDRCCITTEFARARKAYIYYTYGSYAFNGCYCTRSPQYDYSYIARYVLYDGTTYMINEGYVFGPFGVRPALRFTF